MMTTLPKILQGNIVTSQIIVIDDSTQLTWYFHLVLSFQYGHEMILIEAKMDRDRGGCTGDTFWQNGEDGSPGGGYGCDFDTL